MSFEEFAKFVGKQWIYCDTADKQRDLMEYLHNNGIHGDKRLEEDVAYGSDIWVLIGSEDGFGLNITAHGRGDTWLTSTPFITYEEFEDMIGCGQRYACVDDVLAMIS